MPRFHPAAAWVAGLFCAWFGGTLAAQPLLYSISNVDNVVRVVDAATGRTLSTTPVAFSEAQDFNGLRGLARHPGTGELWTIVHSGGHWLSTLDPQSGRATAVRFLSQNVVSLAFAPDGTLYGVTGADPDYRWRRGVFRLDGSVGELAQPLFTFPGGGPATIDPIIADGKLHRAGGGAGLRVLETLDLATLGLSSTSLATFDLEPRALARLHGDEFLLAAGNSEQPPGDQDFLYRLSADAAEPTLVAPLDHRSRGLIVVPEPGALWAAGAGILLVRRRRGRAAA